MIKSIHDKLEKNVCKVICDDDHGTGFLISNQLILTAFHVVSDCENIKVEFNDTKELDVTLHELTTEEYKKLDIAVLKLKEPINFYENIEIINMDLSTGEKWVSRGYPVSKAKTGENFLERYDNCINSQLPKIDGQNDVQLDLYLKLETYSGLSGAPLVVNNAIVGIIKNELLEKGTSKELQGLSIKHFIKLLDELNIKVNVQSCDSVYNECLSDMDEQYQFIIDYLNNNSILKDDLIEACKKYLKKLHIDILIKFENINSIIDHISNHSQFPCIINELYQDNDEELKSWLDDQKFMICREVESISITPLVVIIFGLNSDGKKYDVTFISRNLPGISDGICNEKYDLDDDVSKDKLIMKIMSYIQSDNPIVDLILPQELMLENINLWEVKFNETLSRLTRLNIRYIERYNIRGTLKDLLIKEWNNILSKIATNQSLLYVENEQSMRNIGNNMNEVGIASKYILQKEHLEFILKSEMKFIMLWYTKECTKDLLELYSPNILNLQNEYYKLNENPINLMWDDPTTYYYPDEI
ncbi:serine protease [Sulfurovum sp. TSL1]|uniref:S1 family peptidase n=1 Tax=Sulfurovum sp. TSL1 TaxID=2826994 RepID=UPI001CC4A837|nr:serine protease [Sulfurovum sp. TSL1]GIT97914.1 hypothetical protein TSL1_07350 [Sulfurovum sp. TSL1]